MEKKEPAISIGLNDKPHLLALAKENPVKFREVVQTFTQLAEEAVENDWHTLPEAFGQGKVRLTFADMVKGILHGALDLPELNPEHYPVLKEEVHPLSMLAPRKNYLTGEMQYLNWRDWYKLDPDAPVNQETVATIIRKLLRYYKLVDIEALAWALNTNQIKTFEGLGERNVKLLPIYPALRYQQRVYGNLHSGKYYENVGYFDCGQWIDGNSNECPACQHLTIRHMPPYHVCDFCNAGFKEEDM